MADSTTGPCQPNPATKPGPAIPETCPSGEEPPEATPRKGKPTNNDPTLPTP
jgi:hypothetical protein